MTGCRSWFVEQSRRELSVRKHDLLDQRRGLGEDAQRVTQGVNMVGRDLGIFMFANHETVIFGIKVTRC